MGTRDLEQGCQEVDCQEVDCARDCSAALPRMCTRDLEQGRQEVDCQGGQSGGGLCTRLFCCSPSNVHEGLRAGPPGGRLSGRTVRRWTVHETVLLLSLECARGT